MKWEVLVVTIHVGGIGIRDGLVEGARCLDCFILGVKYLGHVTLQLVSLGLNVFYGEADDCASYLDGHSVLSLQPKLLLQENNCTELGRVVLDVETILLAFDDSVTSTDTDIINSHLTLVASSEFELRLLRSHGQEMNVSRGVLVERHRLQ